MNIFQVLVLSAVEGFTEFLPISSTAHLLLLSSLLKISDQSFLKHFIVFIQLGAITGVLVLYWKRFFLEKKILLFTLLSFFPTAIVGFILYLIVNFFFVTSEIALLGLFIGGGVLIMVDRRILTSPKQTYSLTMMQPAHAVLIGIFQSLAVIPGVSRSAATIIGALFLGLEKKSAVEYSFLLAVPTIAGASIFDLYEGFQTFSYQNLSFLLVGFVASFLFSIIAMRVFLRYLSQGIFLYFGIYRIIFASIMFFLVK